MKCNEAADCFPCEAIVNGCLNKDKGCWGRWCARLMLKNEQLEVKNKQLKQAIENYGNNPASFDWTVLDRIDILENLLKSQKNFMQRLQNTEFIEEAMEREATIEEILK